MDINVCVFREGLEMEWSKVISTTSCKNIETL